MKKIMTNIKNFLKRKNQIEYFWKVRRKMNTSRNPICKFVNWYKYHQILQRNNAFIPRDLELKQDTIFPHGINGIFISQGAKIGEGCTIFHQVTIGSNTLKDSKGYGAPCIGNNVYIGAGAKIIGGVTIGNNVRVGANCIVTCDIPNDCTVVMPKPLIKKHDAKRVNTFVCWNEQV